MLNHNSVSDAQTSQTHKNESNEAINKDIKTEIDKIFRTDEEIYPNIKAENLIEIFRKYEMEIIKLLTKTQPGKIFSKFGSQICKELSDHFLKKILKDYGQKIINDYIKLLDEKKHKRLGVQLLQSIFGKERNKYIVFRASSPNNIPNKYHIDCLLFFFGEELQESLTSEDLELKAAVIRRRENIKEYYTLMDKDTNFIEFLKMIRVRFDYKKPNKPSSNKTKSFKASTNQLLPIKQSFFASTSTSQLDILHFVVEEERASLSETQLSGTDKSTQLKKSKIKSSKRTNESPSEHPPAAKKRLVS